MGKAKVVDVLKPRVEVLSVMQIQGIEGGDPPADSLLKSIESRGVINLPTVREVEPGTYEIVDGRRRIRALMGLGHDQVEVLVNPKVEDADGASLVSNYLRSENVIQAAKVVWKRMDAGETERDIAEEEGIKVEVIRSLRDMRKLRPELIEAVEANLMKPWAARMAARHDPDTTQQELVDRLIKNGKVTAEDVKEVRAVKRTEAVSELGDLFAYLPELGEDDYAEDAENLEYDPAPDPILDGSVGGYLSETNSATKVKVSRQDRIANVVSYATQARKEILAIRSNSRGFLEMAALAKLDELIEMLTAQEG